MLRCPECGAILLRVEGLQRVKVIVEADGGSRGNPGPAGYGAVVFSADRGTVLAETQGSRSAAPPTTSPSTAASSRVWRRPPSMGATEVAVSMDSKLVVEQMSGRWRVKHPDLIPLHQQASELAGRFDHVTYAWIPRAENCHADRLANEAMDAAAEIEHRPAETTEAADAGLARGLDRRPRRPDPAAVAAPRADRAVGRAPLLGPGQPGADRTRPAPGRGRGAYLARAGRHRGRGLLAAAAGLRHRDGRGEGARPRRHRRRRPDRDRLRRRGRA